MAASASPIYIVNSSPVRQSEIFKSKSNDFLKLNCSYVRRMNDFDKTFVFAFCKSFLKITRQLIGRKSLQLNFWTIKGLMLNFRLPFPKRVTKIHMSSPNQTMRSLRGRWQQLLTCNTPSSKGYSCFIIYPV